MAPVRLTKNNNGKNYKQQPCWTIDQEKEYKLIS